MKIAVIGAGPAGLTAAKTLAGSGHQPVVFEANDWIGGRTRTIRPAPGHFVDAGAGWLTTFYPEVLRLLEEYGMDFDLAELDLMSPARISDGGELTQISPAEAITTRLLPFREKFRFVVWILALLLRQHRADLEPDLKYDDIDAKSHTTSAVGPASVDLIFTPLVSAVFADIDALSAALLRTWVRAGLGAKFYALADGMDSLWQTIALELDVRISTPVSKIAVGSSGVDITTGDGDTERFDGCIAAAPITKMREIISGTDLPGWFGEVEYAPHFRVYAAIRGDVERQDIHPLETDEPVATVSKGPAGRLWGRIPEGWSAALVGSSGPWSHELVAADDDEAIERLWERARQIDPELFPIEEAEVVAPVKWAEAVPIFAPGRFKKVKNHLDTQRPPLVFAGDWLVQPCVEGATRSGLAAAAVFGARPGH